MRGNKSDRIGERKLAELLRAGQLSAVFHEDVGVRTLRELARSYLTLTQDVTPVKRTELIRLGLNKSPNLDVAPIRNRAGHHEITSCSGQREKNVR